MTALEELTIPSQSSKTAWPSKLDLFGLQVSAVEYDEAVACIIQAAMYRESAIVSCHAVHAIVTISSDAELCEAANRFAMITPDGQPVRWALNSLHAAKLAERVYGPELMWRVLRQCEATRLSVYLYGGSRECIGALSTQIHTEFPKLTIAGATSPPYRELTSDEMERTAEQINQSGAHVILVGLGCPKQDAFAAAQAHKINGVQICVGAGFDFHAGLKPTAPGWMQRYGLEWLFRLACEPRRLFRRYLVTNSVFVWRWIHARFLRSPLILRLKGQC